MNESLLSTLNFLEFPWVTLRVLSGALCSEHTGKTLFQNPQFRSLELFIFKLKNTVAAHRNTIIVIVIVIVEGHRPGLVGSRHQGLDGSHGKILFGSSRLKTGGVNY